jgi:hypothetical protein
MYGAPGQRDNRPGDTFRIPRGLSPQGYSYRPSPKVVEALYSPPLIHRTDNFSVGITEFVNHLQQQLKRISPNFSFKYSQESPILQASNFVTQAVDAFIEEKTKLIKDSDETKGRTDSYDDEKELAEKQVGNYKSEIEKAKETTKNLGRYEQLLKKKEEKLESEREKIKLEKKKLKEEEEELKSFKEAIKEQERAWQEAKRLDQEKLRIEREEAEKRISESKDLKERVEKRAEDTTKQLKYEKESLAQLELCLSETKLSLAQEQKRLSQEKLQIEKEKWRIDQKLRELEEKESVFNMRTDRLEQEKIYLENERISFYDEVKRYEEEKMSDSEQNAFRITVNNKEFSEIEVLDSKIDREPNVNSVLTSKDLEDREFEIERAYKELQEQMDLCNKELEDKELNMEEREAALARAERDQNIKFEHFLKIKSTLTESKLQLDELRTSTIPDLESQSKQLDKLSKELHTKKKEIELLYFRLTKEIEYFQRKQIKNEVIYEVNAEDWNGEELQQLANDLEEKMKKLRIREEELEKENEEITNEKDQILQATEYLKRAHLEAEEKKNRYDQENAKEKEKLKMQFIKLESGMRLLSTKEAEVQALKKKLEEKEHLLKIKERDLEQQEKDHRPTDE